MVERIATDIVGQMAEAKMINKTQEEYYIYSLIAIIEKVITIGTILVYRIAISCAYMRNVV